MASKNITKLTGEEQVKGFMKKLEHPLKKSIEEFREVILSSNKGISEHIKWNAPSFCYNGEDRITFNLRTDHFMLIFHRGAKAKDNKKFIFNEGEELLEWLAPDRAVVKFYSVEEVKAKKSILKKVVSEWIKV